MTTMNGKVVVVAGASRGIGAVTALAFARAGASVVLGARDVAAVEQVAADIRKAGGQALGMPLDVGDAGSSQRFVQRAVDEFGRLDAAFNNATDGPMPAPLADIDPDEFDAGIRTNIRGTFLGMKYQIPAMLASGGGAIVNMASIAGVQATANLSAYVAGKAGIIGLTKVAALDYADKGIRVNVVAPGPILTHHLQAAGEQAQRMAGLSTPMRRIGQSEEVAAAVVWLCSPEASFITGVTLPIDGGQFAGNKPPQMYRQGQPMVKPTITRDELLAAVEQKAVTVVDALPAGPFARRHLPGAVNLVIDDVVTEAPKVLPGKDSAIVTYSTDANCGRGEALAAKLRELGYTNVRVYSDGIEDWVAAGLDVRP
jgi:NAD(P)-dependent dehydrogenase (short-subunit alcohol dehydrogenase family)/rhodanese-related sulfurtransferase